MLFSQKNIIVLFLFISLIITTYIYSATTTSLPATDVRMVSKDQYGHVGNVQTGYYEVGLGYESFWFYKRSASTYNPAEIPDYAFVNWGKIKFQNVLVPDNPADLRMRNMETKASTITNGAALLSEAKKGSLVCDETINSTYGADNFFPLDSPFTSEMQSIVELNRDWVSIGFYHNGDSDEIQEEPRVSTYFPFNSNRLRINWEIRMSSSGTLTQNEKWGGSHTLTNDVYVPSGKTLVLWSGLSLNLNGHQLRSTGGTITRQSNVTINGMASYAKSGSNYKGFYPASVSVQQIMDWASSGWVIKLQPGTFNGDISMKTGVDILGSGTSSTIINGSINCNHVGNCELAYFKVEDEITLDAISGWIDLHHVKIKDRLYVLDCTHEAGLTDISTQNSGYIHAQNSLAYIAYYSSSNGTSVGLKATGSASDVICEYATIKNKTYSAVQGEFSSDCYLEAVDLCENTDPSGYDITSVYSASVDAYNVMEWSECPYAVNTYSGGSIDLPDPEDCVE